MELSPKVYWGLSLAWAGSATFLSWFKVLLSPLGNGRSESGWILGVFKCGTGPRIFCLCALSPSKLCFSPTAWSEGLRHWETSAQIGHWSSCNSESGCKSGMQGSLSGVKRFVLHLRTSDPWETRQEKAFLMHLWIRGIETSCEFIPC